MRTTAGNRTQAPFAAVDVRLWRLLLFAFLVACSGASDASSTGVSESVAMKDPDRLLAELNEAGVVTTRQVDTFGTEPRRRHRNPDMRWSRKSHGLHVQRRSGCQRSGCSDRSGRSLKRRQRQHCVGGPSPLLAAGTDAPLVPGRRRRHRGFACRTARTALRSRSRAGSRYERWTPLLRRGLNSRDVHLGCQKPTGMNCSNGSTLTLQLPIESTRGDSGATSIGTRASWSPQSDHAERLRKPHGPKTFGEYGIRFGLWPH